MGLKSGKENAPHRPRTASTTSAVRRGVVDGEEIAAAWWTRGKIVEQTASGELILPPEDSISHRLVADWIEGGE